MCRLLLVKSPKPFSIVPHLQQFAVISKNSKEYQGHGWGCAYLKNNQWQFYSNIKPIWEDDLTQFGETHLLMAHARSAFEDKGIDVKNNMPFHSNNLAFIFNGELRGVRIKEKGRIGAEKIFNYIQRFYRDDFVNAFEKGIGIINKRTQYIRAMNIIISDKNQVYVSSQFNEDAEYFTMHYKNENDELVICSQPYPRQNNWKQIENNSIKVF